jgi:hypothetical protein
MPISRRHAASVIDMTSGVISLLPTRSAVLWRFAIRSTGTMPRLCRSRSKTSQPSLVSAAYTVWSCRYSVTIRTPSSTDSRRAAVAMRRRASQNMVMSRGLSKVIRGGSPSSPDPTATYSRP